MKNINELSNLMIALIEDVGHDISFSDKSKVIIHDIAEYARQLELYKHYSYDSDSFMEEWRAEETVTAKAVYLHMLYKIVNAPTVLHRNMSIILFMPIIDDMLTQNNAEAGIENAV